MPEKPQSNQSHGRIDPAFHLFLAPVSLVLTIAAIVNLVRNFGWASGWIALATLSVIIAAGLLMFARWIPVHRAEAAPALVPAVAPPLPAVPPVPGL